MSFDYIEITKSLSKDKPCLDYLEKEASYSSGWIKFYHEGCKALEIWLQPEFFKMKIKGSFPYFIAGQNFKTGMEDFKNGVDYLASILEVNLYESEVKTFEFGTIVKSLFHPKQIMNSHLKVKGMKTRAFDNGKYFEDKILRIKIYDAGRNIKTKLTSQERKSLEVNFGYNPSSQYLRVENHYKKPEVCFKRRSIYVNDLLEESFQTICKDDLVNKYNSIMKTKKTNCTNKKQLTSSTIPLLILKEYEEFLPSSIEDLIKHKIKSIPEEILGKEDKKSRNRQIKSNLKKLEFKSSCEYDISEVLKEELNMNSLKLEVPLLEKQVPFFNKHPHLVTITSHL